MGADEAMKTKAKKPAVAKTTAERMSEMRARRAQEGLVKLELWAKPELHERIKAYVARISR